MSLAYLGLGSNLGDRVGYIQQAVQFLKDTPNIKVIDTSSLYETEPIGLVSEKWFVNAVVEIETTLEPEQLLETCMNIEQRLGRSRELTAPKALYQSRTVDIDILFYDDIILANDTISIPHPRVHERAYALVPLLELAPDFVHPILGNTIKFIHRTLLEPEEVYLFGTRREE